MMEIWQGRVLWWGYVHPHLHPHTKLKNQGFPIPIPIPSQCRDSPSKRGQGQTIPKGTSLFAISKNSKLSRVEGSLLKVLEKESDDLNQEIKQNGQGRIKAKLKYWKIKTKWKQ